MRLRNVAGSRIDPDVLVRPPSWTKDAACIGEDARRRTPERRARSAELQRIHRAAKRAAARGGS